MKTRSVITMAGAVFVVALTVALYVAGPQARPPVKPIFERGRPLPANPQIDVKVEPDFLLPDTGKVPPTGYIPNPEGTEKFLQSLEKPTIREAGPELFMPKNNPIRGPPPQADADEKGVYLWRALQKAHLKTYGREWRCGTQGIGDCVSWGWMHASAIASAIEFTQGKSAEWYMPATEAIYGGSRVEARGSPGDGSRPYGGYSDGSYGAAAAKWVKERGGILFRLKYDKFDLTTYSADRAKEWGAYGCGGKGDGEVADKLAAKHPAKSVALVKTFEEAAAAIRSGYPVAVCSSQGFTSRRDDDGFCRGSGSWAHCMCFIAVRFDRPGLLCLNSWGTNWVTGPKFPADQPDGSFWVEPGTVDRMLSSSWGADSFAVSATDGFPYRPLDNGDWVYNNHSSEGKSRIVTNESALSP